MLGHGTEATGSSNLFGENATFELTTKALPELKPDQVLVEALYLSNDPAQRTWMSLDVAAKRHYSKPGDSLHSRLVRLGVQY